MFKGFCKYILGCVQISQEFFNCVSMVFQGWFKDVSRLFPDQLKHVSPLSPKFLRVCQGCLSMFKDVYRISSVTRVFEGLFKSKFIAVYCCI